MNRREFFHTAVGAAAGLVVFTACSDENPSAGSGDTSNGSDPRPLTLPEAGLLAGMLFNNYDIGGATFTVNATFNISGDTLALAGTIDWKNHIGHTQVNATGAEAGVSEVYWEETAVIETRAGLPEALVAAGHPTGIYISRAPDPTGRQIDGLLGLVLGLASKQRDNPQLVQQTETARYLRTDTIRDVPVTVFQYDSSQLWLDSDGTMLRYTGISADGNRPVTIDLLTIAPVTIEPPAADSVIVYGDAAAAYDAVASG